MGWMSKPVVGEGHITILGPSYDSIGQGTWIAGVDEDQWLQGYLLNTSDTNGDNLSYKVYLDAGTYTLMLYTYIAPNMGIVDFDIDDIEVASFDLYSDENVPNTQKTQTGIVIATPGLKTLNCRVDGHSHNGIDYYTFISYIALWRTA